MGLIQTFVVFIEISLDRKHLKHLTKSPPKTITLPPNGCGQSIMSLSVLSTDSIVYFFAIGASSQIINFAFRINFALALCFGMLHIDVSFASKGMLNLECAVRPPDNIDAATPDVAVAKAIIPFDLIVAKSA
ncbi:putative Zinc finger, BED-type [Cucumis melo var. makuwa]|uniref:Zinc finger, BED-type n=1 Tax=Cucumis melo var. makuwa TaxID=1194695 RepID=A0A5A7UAG9_CUCMM|nr:putative Zinc finger, BED-type [Cucumis melo var. makuwa]TYK09425.1 putative Zinc finger, BED-type [Cucumis melo var. makuwa]